MFCVTELYLKNKENLCLCMKKQQKGRKSLVSLKLELDFAGPAVVGPQR